MLEALARTHTHTHTYTCVSNEVDRQEFNGEWQDWSKVPCSSKVGKGFRSGSRDVCECVRAGVYLCMGLPE